MTAPAAPLVTGPIAPPAPRAAPQLPADRFAFASMLDSLPNAPAKAGASNVEDEPHPSNEPKDPPPRGQTAYHSLATDSGLLASLPFAVRTAETPGAQPQAGDGASIGAAPSMKGPKPNDDDAALAGGVKTPGVARLIGERAFHGDASGFAGTAASRSLAVNAAFGSPSGERGASSANLLPSTVIPAESSTHAAPSLADASVPVIAPRGAAVQTNRPTRAAAHEAAHGARKLETVDEAPAAKVSAPAPVTTESSAKPLDSRVPDSLQAPPPTIMQTSSFGALPGAFASPSFEPRASVTGAATADVAPRANALAASAPSTSPVKEIDVDLSPGGLEDVSMTMRLAGDKLSVVIRAGSSHTLNSIEGARDAIADRLAAIGQPLDSLIVQQTGVNAEGNANGSASSDQGSQEGGRSAQGSGGRDDADNPLSRRGAHGDRSF